MLPGISRPALAAVMPIPGHHLLLLDVGANVDCRPRHLVDFAIMGSIYAEEIFGRPSPRVGVLSIGEEDVKGNELTLAVFKELKNSKLKFVGNAEGRDILATKFDVIVCDGFVGNCLLKFRINSAERRSWASMASASWATDRAGPSQSKTPYCSRPRLPSGR
jgi:glycerol-3-phosphate acyltransferase PlsX